MEEIWKDIERYESLYQVSNMGRVRSVRKKGSDGRIMKAYLYHHGYLGVNLWKNSVMEHARVHRLVALAFVPNPRGVETVNHIDQNRLNNRADNLEWMTLQENNRYSNTERFLTLGPKVLQRKVDMYSKDGVFIRQFDSIAEAAKHIDGHPQCVGECCRGKLKSTRGYKFEYAKEERI